MVRFSLPKSGTTLVEKILDILPYVRLNNSFYKFTLLVKKSMTMEFLTIISIILPMINLFFKNTYSL